MHKQGTKNTIERHIYTDEFPAAMAVLEEYDKKLKIEKPEEEVQPVMPAVTETVKPVELAEKPQPTEKEINTEQQEQSAVKETAKPQAPKPAIKPEKQTLQETTPKTEPTPEAAETPVEIKSEPKDEPIDINAYAQKSHITKDDRYFHPWAANAPYAKTADNQTVPWAGEELQFGVHYGFVRAGTAYINSNGITDTDLGPAYRIETIANSSKGIDAVFKVRDINYSWISAKDFSSLGYSQSVREGGYFRDEWITFNAPKMLYYGMVKRKKGPEPIEGITNGPVQDMLTSLFYVRMQDLTAKKEITFDVANREEFYPLVVRVIKREKVKVPAGTFNCIVVEPAFRGEGIFIVKGTSLKVWLTDDDRKMPVKMETEVFIGSVSATLESYKRK